MKRSILAVITLGFMAACERAPRHSPELDRVLNQYSPVFRLGATVQELNSVGKLRFETPYYHEASALMLFPKPIEGFAGVRIMFRLESDSIRATDTATGYILFSDTLKVVAAESAAVAHLTRTLGPPAEKGCSKDARPVLAWPREDGGAVLYLPSRRSNAHRNDREVKMIIFASHTGVADALPAYAPSPCR